MIVDDHQRARVKARVNGTCGVGQDQDPKTENAQHADGEGHCLKAVAFVDMTAPRQGDHRAAVDAPRYGAPIMTRNQRCGPVRQPVVRHRDGIVERLDEAAEAGPEDDPDRRNLGDTGFHRVSGFSDLLVVIQASPLRHRELCEHRGYTTTETRSHGVFDTASRCSVPRCLCG